jgi:hypothetical protein
MIFICLAIEGKAIEFFAVILLLILISCSSGDEPEDSVSFTGDVVLSEPEPLVAEYPLPNILVPTIEPIPEPPNSALRTSNFSYAILPRVEVAPPMMPFVLYSCCNISASLLIYHYLLSCIFSFSSSRYLINKPTYTSLSQGNIFSSSVKLYLWCCINAKLV